MGYRTIGALRKVNYEDKELYIDYLSQNLSLLNESYIVQPISKISLSYIIKDGLCNEKNRALLLNLEEKSTRFHNFNNLNLPISMNPGDYGDIRSSSYVELDGVTYHRFIVKNGNKTFEIDRSLDRSHNKVSMWNIDLTWIDTRLTDLGTDIFMREIRKSTIYFMDGEVVLRKQILPAKPFRKLQIDNKINNNFYTMDIETITKDNKLTPYLICAYNGKDSVISYSLDQKVLFNTFFDQLLANVKSTATVYAHNLSSFDGIFLLKHLLSYGKVEPLLFNGKLISIKIKILSEGNSKTILFKDSYLLLPLSLRKLCTAFNIPIPKGYFPFKLTNIFYTGVLPKFEYWTGVTISEYGLIKTNFGVKMWSFKDEAIKYCKLDCQTLHEILTKFNELIFNEFKVNIHIPLTLPSLAMRIYKTHYMPDASIYQLLGTQEENIRQSYTGGAVDVYIPHNRISGTINQSVTFALTKNAELATILSYITLYYYDVNSLYPYIMAKTPMPIGKPIAFTGDIRKIDPNAYGFFYCEITSPNELNNPLLQRRIKTVDGVRTIAGLGTWEGWICSTPQRGEMDNAVKFGYSFEILNGYQFDKGNIFLLSSPRTEVRICIKNV
jgi:hypothetical protein